MPFTFTSATVNGLTLVTGPAGQPLLRATKDAIEIVQACADYDTRRVVLYAENLTPHFFDLSSREAGEILGKLRQYGVRLAVVYDPAVTRLSTHFAALLVEENRQPYFRLFTDLAAAQAWLTQPA
ncbi:MAG: DUF4180 domain-containing protein [Anaerolineales bacterium]|nr:DUF4180 domain-containing protein [Anaerolineales bacterium]